ncbi:MAG: sulfite exporter TauE/SafE family protein [Gammaproteobacteria bacterium]|nr:sulfite exporter TauE/SafE family protein [Gammaproteobacteria bacterium]MBU2058736.1 sulfite exporter TauE/SafE family protein [Gammaproteobacteria bacterium]MBU2176993.1 sulfite exporter TauE/SafE family protein [Gammaproteobacteria bacterium]MBU2246440.1 sulfite exporter TauE/SafE family protein [Gammaproteobacteria bacterium]MBU2345433.1 sulfite exporter TauE/SafE family protein [Gammaproteobacteria bacterium]
MNAELAVNLVAALSIGFLGSSHCLVMCGGIASALQLSMPGLNLMQQLKLQLMLSVGRLITYSLLGALTGAFGAALLVKLGISLFWLKLLAGILLLLMAFYVARLWFALTVLEKFGSALWRKVQPVAKTLLPLDSSAKALAYGLCWGFLPCGLVYSSLGWSLASGSALQGALLMLAFGLGTLPAMLAVGSFARQLSQFKNNTLIRACAACVLAFYALYTIAIALAPRLF